MPEAYLVAAARTPIGRFGGMLQAYSATDLAAHVMRAVLERARLKPVQLDLCILGQVLRAGQGQLVPRQAALKAGIPESVDAFAVDMVCSSGMMAVMQATALVKAGEADVVLAGGTESMTNAGFYLSSRARWGYKLLVGSPEPMTDILLRDGLTDPVTGEAMGEQAERLAAEYGIGREDLDRVASESHRRAAQAERDGLFSAEIVPVEIKEKGGVSVRAADEGVREDTTLASLGKLRPAFRGEGVLTAGNSSQISDGAAAMLVVSEEAMNRYELEPLARVIGATWSAGETWRFPEAPVPAVKKLLERIAMRVEDFDLFENNEAFALNNLLFERLLSVPAERLNPHGGAVALGHPIGASGARIITTLAHALRGKGLSRGLAAVCHGTGGSTAMAIERV